MRHSVPTMKLLPGWRGMSACEHCGSFGVNDGEEGCGGKEEREAALARLMEYVKEHPPRLVCVVGTVESVDENGSFRVKVKS